MEEENTVGEAKVRNPSEGKKAAAKAESQAEKWLRENKVMALLGVVLVVVAGYAILNLFQEPPEADIGDFHGGNGGVTAPEKVKFIMIYSKECYLCEVDGSFVMLLNKNGIEWTGEKYEASSDDGKRIIAELGLAKLPIIMVDGQSISASMLVRSDEQLQLSTAKGIVSALPLRDFLNSLVRLYPNEVIYNRASDIYVLPELGLDGKRHIDFLLDAEECLPDNPEETLARVDLFVDPYGSPYIKSTEALDFYRDYYRDRLEFNYRYLPVDASKKFDPLVPWGNIENLARYIVCADEQGFLQEAESAFYARYCRLNDNNVLDSPERQNCPDSNHFGFPVLGDEADLISKIDLNYNPRQFAECLEALPEQFAADRALAEQLHVYRVPTVVINCRYSTHAINIDRSLCKLDEEMEHCLLFG